MDKRKTGKSELSGQDDSETAKYRAPALDKGLDILELLAETESPLALSDIARSLGRTVGEIFRMVTTLERRGYLDLDESGERYSISLKMFRLAHLIPPIKHISAASTDVMKKLARDISQSCQIAVHHNGRLLIIVQEHSPTNRNFSVRLGAELNLTTTASGRVLLAYSDEERRQEMLNLAATYGDIPEMSPEEFETILSTIKTKGINRQKSKYTTGVTDVGCPIRGFDGDVVASLTIPFLGRIDKQQVSLDSVLPKLKEAAQTISERMGYIPEK